MLYTKVRKLGDIMILIILGFSLIFIGAGVAILLDRHNCSNTTRTMLGVPITAFGLFGYEMFFMLIGAY